MHALRFLGHIVRVVATPFVFVVLVPIVIPGLAIHAIYKALSKSVRDVWEETR